MSAESETTNAEIEEAAPAFAPLPAAEAQLLARLRQGDPEAGQQLVSDYYPGVYRYLRYLTGRAELAEDLTQETFLQAWRHLETFEGRAPLRLWLHRIAHREFLQALRSQRPHTSLEEIAEPPHPASPGTRPAADWTEAIELRDAIRKLPIEEGEVVVLHYLHGYNCEEIARIVRAPVTTVKYRLMTARAHLQRELGEGDLVYLNPPSAPMRQWAWLPLDRMRALEARLSMVGGQGLMVGGPAKAKAAPSSSAPSTISHQPSTKGEQTMDRKTSTGMSRRKLLEAAGTAAAAVAAGPVATAAPNEADVIDSRLTRKVTLAFKATALSDVCDRLRAETGVAITAGPSVADEKVTLFCKELPLREVMRQLGHPFGYTWLRSGAPGQYRYELAQDLRSQLLEEELRNRDRNAALLALQQDLDRYRPYLDLSPDEIVERAKTAPPEEKKLLENLGGGDLRSSLGWGPIQMYFRLNAEQMAALRAGEELRFGEDPKPGELPLPPDVARGILQGWRVDRIIRVRRDGSLGLTQDLNDPDGVPVHTVPELRATQNLTLRQTELGQYGLGGASGFRCPGWGHDLTRQPYAVGMCPAVLNADNAAVNARLARDPALQGRVTVEPDGRRQTADGSPTKTAAAGTGAPTTVYRLPSTVSEKLTTADVLEALHRATGLPVVADFYTRLYKPEAVSVQDRPLFDALNHLADTMRLRWHKEGSWLQFRSTSFYDDRLKEVPNRLLSRWAAARHEHPGGGAQRGEVLYPIRERGNGPQDGVGGLRLDDLVEIGQLSDDQLKAAGMAEGAKELWGLAEWDLARNPWVLPSLRFLAGFTPEQRREAESPAGLPFTKMTLAQQQGFLARAFPAQAEGLQSMEELAGATLLVDYTQPGWYEWQPTGPWWLRWIVPLAFGPNGKRALRPPVRARTREAALEALRQVDPETRAAVLAAALRADPRIEKALPDDAAQIVPTELNIQTVYIPDTTNRHRVTKISRDDRSDSYTW